MKLRLLAALAASAFTLASTPSRAVTEDEMKKAIAFMINMNGHLCAEVVTVNPLRLQDQYEITCVEYRGGSGTVRYIMNAREGTAFPA